MGLLVWFYDFREDLLIESQTGRKKCYVGNLIGLLNHVNNVLQTCIAHCCLPQSWVEATRNSHQIFCFVSISDLAMSVVLLWPLATEIGRLKLSRSTIFSCYTKKFEPSNIFIPEPVLVACNQRLGWADYVLRDEHLMGPVTALQILQLYPGSTFKIKDTSNKSTFISGKNGTDLGALTETE